MVWLLVDTLGAALVGLTLAALEVLVVAPARARRRHRRSLAHIAELERELGVGVPLEDRIWRATSEAAGLVTGDRALRVAPAVKVGPAVIAYCLACRRQVDVAHGFCRGGGSGCARVLRSRAMSGPTHLPPNWSWRLLAVLGAPTTTSNVNLLDAWARAEGGEAAWNPLNTTYLLPGATEYNSAGVRNFAKPIDGICATALTLDNGDYRGIVGDLQAGKYTAREIVTRNAHEFDTWGTGSAAVLAVLGGPV